MASMKSKRRRGIAAVEFALVAIPLLLLIFAVIDFGWLFLKAQQITQAARAGARVAIVADSTNATVEAAINNWMAEAEITEFSYDVTPDDISAVSPGAAIKVEVIVPTSQFTLLNWNLIPVPAEVHAAASMVKEGT